MQGSLDSVVVWTPLVDVDLSLGAIQAAPGSHRCGLLAEDYTDDFGIVTQFSDEDFVSVEMRKGGALFFSAFLKGRWSQDTLCIRQDKAAYVAVEPRDES